MSEEILTLRLRSFVVQKQGNRLVDCEDSASVSQRTARCAVADGASQSWAARDWARTLTRCWVADPPGRPSDFEAWLTRAQANFAERDFVEAPELPAYLSQSRSDRTDAAHATLVGVALVGETEADLRVLAVGDSYAFIVRQGDLVGTVPHGADHATFGSTPELLPSCGPAPVAPAAASLRAEPGDRCYLVTDALAEVLRDRHVDGEPLWGRLDTLDGSGFLDLVAELREEGMANDDTALVVAAIEPRGEVVRF